MTEPISDLCAPGWHDRYERERSARQEAEHVLRLIAALPDGFQVGGGHVPNDAVQAAREYLATKEHP